jgi:hypothetical protein
MVDFMEKDTADPQKVQRVTKWTAITTSLPQEGENPLYENPRASSQLMDKLYQVMDFMEEAY